MKKSKLLVSLLATALVAGMSGCKKDPLDDEDQDIVAVYRAYTANAEANGETPLSYEDWLKSVKGEKGDPGEPGAPGKDGRDGKDAVAPTIEIGSNGNWFINGVDSGKKAQGEKGADAQAPKIEIGVNNHWYVNDQDTGVVAKGENGADAIAPVVSINGDGYWCVNNVPTAVKATGAKGDKGDPGDVGPTGKSAYDIFCEAYPHYDKGEYDWAVDLARGELGKLEPGHGDNATNIQISEDDNKVYMDATCSVCGASYRYKELEKVTPATYSFSGRSGYEFELDEATGCYVSKNKGVNSSFAYLDITIETPGLISFDYTSSGEGMSDYLYCLLNTSNEDDNEFTCKAGDNNEHTISGSYEKVLAAGDKLSLIFKKDSSVNKGDDCATIKFKNGAPVYGVLDVELNGGKGVTPMFLMNGKPVGTVENPTQDGKYFEGWFTDAGLNTPYESSTPFEGNGKVYAKWSDAQYVTFNVDGGSDIAPVAFRATEAPVMPADPIKSGFIFVGWYTDPDLADAHKYVPGAANASFNLYARWFDETLANPMNGHYTGVKQSGRDNPSAGNTELDVDVLGNYKMRENYSAYFEGTLGAFDAYGVASTNNNGKVVYDATREIAVVSKAADIKGDTNIFIVSKDGSLTSSNVKYKSLKLGNTTYGVRIYTIVLGTEKINVVVDADSDKIIYNASIRNIDGDVVYADTIDSNELFLSVTEPGTFAVTNYSLGKSSYSTTISDGIYGTFNNDTIGAIKFSGNGKAIWTGITNGLFDYEEIGTNQYYLYQASIYRYVVTVDPLSSSYTYSVRTVNATFDLNYDGAPAASTYPVTYNYYLDIDDIEGLNATPTRDGYSFDGWYTAATAGDKKERISISEDTTFYAHWNEAVTITINKNNGETPAATNFVKGSAPTIAVPFKENCVFGGWYTDAALTEPWDGVATESVSNIYAKYFELNYAGTYAGDEVCYSTYYNKTYNAGYRLDVNANGTFSGRATDTFVGAKSADGNKIDFANGKKLYTFEVDGRRFIAMHYNGLSAQSYITTDIALFAKVNENETVSMVYSSLGSNLYAVEVSIYDSAADTTSNYSFFVKNNSNVQEWYNATFYLDGDKISASQINSDNKGNVVIKDSNGNEIAR